ncbi:hypothetical protein FA10DRAFT_280667 [Acaromyces ingoldii]|uniref:Cytochrome P450 n=1 Tax=Acaromyces ingoldii TaxID=215250 RepID=A0A316YLQ4_9BASI|nr:hypothetical protein FA10DRAFT_280667 [Acaromyces ingoldii]PWN89734.1 hypothetical protein FA10DRAFT_280667 [Acaromyces ingoldii]
MLALADVLFLLCATAAVALANGLYRLRRRQQAQASAATKQAVDPLAFFASPEPCTSVTPDNLATYPGARDHIYVNRVLRHPYHQVMGHQPMQSNDWIEVDANYVGDLRKKAELIATQGKVVLDVVDDAAVRLGCQELMEHVSSWLTVRYPALFQWADGGKRAIHNLVTGLTLDLYHGHFSRKASHKEGGHGTLKDGADALLVVSQLVQDDFLIGSPLPDGHWLCAGGIVAFPGFYLLSDKIGTTLMQTHDPVPQFNEKLLFSVERTLTRLEPTKPIERTSWEIVDSEEDQFWVPMAGPLPTGSGAKPTAPHHLTGRAEDASATEDASQLVLRLDHQTFVKMPKSRIVFFGVHPFRRRLEQLRGSPLLPRLLLDIHEHAPADLMKYKGAPLYQASVLPFLRTLDQWQRDHGLVQGGERSQDFRLYKGNHL